jgi:hypothetical protein
LIGSAKKPSVKDGNTFQAVKIFASLLAYRKMGPFITMARRLTLFQAMIHIK